jgi:hypothetical protein
MSNIGGIAEQMISLFERSTDINYIEANGLSGLGGKTVRFNLALRETKEKYNQSKRAPIFNTLEPMYEAAFPTMVRLKGAFTSTGDFELGEVYIAFDYSTNSLFNPYQRTDPWKPTFQGEINDTILNLNWNERYYVRAVAFVDDIISYGSVRTFYTLNSPFVQSLGIQYDAGTPLQVSIGGNITYLGDFSVGDAYAHAQLSLTPDFPVAERLQSSTIPNVGIGEHWVTINYGMQRETTYYYRFLVSIHTSDVTSEVGTFTTA